MKVRLKIVSIKEIKSVGMQASLIVEMKNEGAQFCPTEGTRPNSAQVDTIKKADQSLQIEIPVASMATQVEVKTFEKESQAASPNVSSKTQTIFVPQQQGPDPDTKVHVSKKIPAQGTTPEEELKKILIGIKPVNIENKLEDSEPFGKSLITGTSFLYSPSNPEFRKNQKPKYYELRINKISENISLLFCHNREELLRERICCYIELGKYGKALTDLSELESKHKYPKKDEKFYYLNRFACYLFCKDSANKEEEREQKLEEASGKLKDLKEFISHNISQALLALFGIGENGKKSKEARCEHAIKYFKKAKHGFEKELKKEFNNSSEEKNPRDVRSNEIGVIYKNLYLIFKLQKEFGKAYEELKEFISKYVLKAPHNYGLDAISEFGFALYNLKNSAKLKDGIEFYEKEMAGQFKNYSLFNNMGRVYWKNKQLGKAQKCFENAVKLNKKGFEAHYNLGLIYLKQGLEQRNKVFKIFESIKNKNEYSSFLKALAEVEDKLSEALKKIKKAIEIYEEKSNIENFRYYAKDKFLRFYKDSNIACQELINIWQVQIHILNIFVSSTKQSVEISQKTKSSHNKVLDTMYCIRKYFDFEECKNIWKLEKASIDNVNESAKNGKKLIEKLEIQIKEKREFIKEKEESTRKNNGEIDQLKTSIEKNKTMIEQPK
ncbi:tetratricopeptide repeat protein [Candidatus Margulisiibacteriota bacterium]